MAQSQKSMHDELDSETDSLHSLERKSLVQYTKTFSRDFCLPSVEAWVRGETTNPKDWTKLRQPFLPYIVAHRNDDTVHFYYASRGVDWVQGLLVKLAKEDKNFLEKIEKTILKKLEYIRPIYENETVLTLPDLKRFLKELEAGYPWFEAMWWYCQMPTEKLAGLNVESLQKVRILTDKLSNSSDVVIRNSLAKIYPDFGELSACLRTQEIMSGKLPVKSELEKRDRGYFFSNDQLFIMTDQRQIEKIFKIELGKEETDRPSESITGEIAQKGKAKGTVRRVMGHKQISTMKQGEILVSPMTMPDFLPAMKKAAAIVTDEGGITCHAAIVARELQIPCIVGTKYGTQIFKNGDFVEVDADKGIARKIPESR